MALLKNKVRSNNQYMQGLKALGSQFFIIYNEFQFNPDYSEMKVMSIKPVLEEIALLNQEKKQALCANRLAMNELDWERMTSILEAELYYQQVIQALQLVEECKQTYLLNKAASSHVLNFYVYLQQFLAQSEEQWREQEPIQEKIKQYFMELAKVLKENREIYAGRIVTTRVWNGWKEQASEGLQTQEYEFRLDLLRNVRLIERVAAVFDAISKDHTILLNGWLSDRNIQHYFWKELVV